VSLIFTSYRPVKLILLTPIIAVCLFYLDLTNSTWIISPDSVDYVEGAISLAKLHGYADYRGKALTFFPPGTSFVYSFAALISRDDYVNFNLLTKLLMIGYLLFGYRLVSRRYGSVCGLIVFLFLSFSIISLQQSVRILSDVLFSFLFIVTLFFFPPEKLEKASRSQLLLLGCLITFCYFVRAHGLYVLCGYALYISCFVRSGKAKALATISIVFLIGASLLWVRNQRYPSEWSYAKLHSLKGLWEKDSGKAGLSDWRDRVVARSGATLLIVCNSFSNEKTISWRGVLLMMVAVAGIIFGARDKYFLFLLSFLPFYFAGLLITDQQEPRYLLSVAPLLFFCAFKGFSWLYRLLPRNIPQLLPATVLALLLVLNPYWKIGFAYSQYLKDAFRLSETNICYLGHEGFQKLVEENNPYLGKGDIVTTNHPKILRYLVPSYVGLKYFVITKDVKKIHDGFLSQKVTYVYVDNQSGSFRHIQEAVDAYRNEFLLVSRNNQGGIYKAAFHD